MRPVRTPLLKFHLFLTAALLGTPASQALAQGAAAAPRIGFINTQRVMHDAAVAQQAQKQIEDEFRPRDAELQRLGERLKSAREDAERNAVTMGEADRRVKEREINDLTRELERKQREFGEDLQARRNEAMAQVIGRANGVIRQIAEQEKMDIIFQDAVYASPRIDITDKVIKALDAAPSRPAAK
jgi:outer membrane protein